MIQLSSEVFLLKEFVFPVNDSGGVDRFIALSTRDRIIVAMSVLLDGFEAIDYLKVRFENRDSLIHAASEILNIPYDVRSPLLGTLLRCAIEESTKSHAPR